MTFQDCHMSNSASISGKLGCFSRWAFLGGLNFATMKVVITVISGKGGGELCCSQFSVMIDNTLGTGTLANDHTAAVTAAAAAAVAAAAAAAAAAVIFVAGVVLWDRYMLSNAQQIE